MIVTYCYLGWNVAGFIATEIVDPQRTLPRVMIGGTAFVALIYVLLNVVYLSAVSISTLAQEPIVPVITSYSIHYTKLYEIGFGQRQTAHAALRRRADAGKIHERAPQALTIDARNNFV